ncbi:pentapeptide repeat-containing protein [Streptomyces sp. NPDC090085]|uniref:pentapeptide repeat-containing protein n=1 Tax=Streptomyces sp. NPDC090085 TaxID=3365943 RepID=UPI00382FE0A3
MSTRTYGRTTVTLPDLTEPGLYLSNVDSLEAPRGVLQDFRYTDASLRALELDHARLVTGSITTLDAARAHLDSVDLHSVEIVGTSIQSAQWTDSKLSRVVFRNCKLMGAMFKGVTFDDVLFEGCKLDYATFEDVRATGPLVFTGCSLRESEFTGCSLEQAVLTDCDLRLAEFQRGRYRDMDLRGNDLTSLRGVGSLSRVIVDRAQQLELAQALTAELDITFGDELNES